MRTNPEDSQKPIESDAPLKEDIQKTVLLVEAAQQGDAAALDALFSRYLPRVRQIVALRLGRRLRDMMEIEDVVQETLLRALRGLDRFRHVSDGSFRNWLSRCVQSATVDMIRVETRQKRGDGAVRRFSDHDASILHSSIFAGDGFTPSQHAVASELVERIEEELLTMPEHERELIVMRAVCGMSFQEIADEVGISAASTVRVAYHRASGKLQKKVSG